MGYNNLLEWNISQIGQGNDADGSNKYLEWYYGYRAKTYWCAIFQTYGFNELGILDRLNGLTNTAGCEPWRRWAVANKIWGTTPKVGAIVLFDWNPKDYDGADHIGIVEKIIDSNTIQTIEGNTSANGSQSNGGRVMRKTRYKSDIMGYVYVDTTVPGNRYTIYGQGTVKSTTGVSVHSAPKFGTATDEVRPFGEVLYCFGTHQAEGYEWWKIDATGTRWVRKTSLYQRKGYVKTVYFIYGEGVVNSLTGVRVFSRPGKAYATEEVINHGITLYCYGSNNAEDSTMEWWAINKERTKWVRKTSLRDRKGYTKWIEAR